MNTLYSFTAQ